MPYSIDAAQPALSYGRVGALKSEALPQCTVAPLQLREAPQHRRAVRLEEDPANDLGAGRCAR